MKTYTVMIKNSPNRFTLRARSNKQAMILAANNPNIEPGSIVRIFQGGYGFDSGWKVKTSKFNM